MDFKVRCIEAFQDHFTVGKIYEVKSSVIRDDRGNNQISAHRDITDVDSLNEALISQFELIPDLPRICYVLGGEDNPLKIGEIFECSGLHYSIGQGGYIYCEDADINTSTLCGLINGAKIIRQPQFSEDEKALMRLFVGVGYPTIERKESHLWAWNESMKIGTLLPIRMLPQITIENSPFDAKAYLEGLK